MCITIMKEKIITKIVKKDRTNIIFHTHIYIYKPSINDGNKGNVIFFKKKVV